MHSALPPLFLTALLSLPVSSLAMEQGNRGMSLYSNSVTAAKSQVEPVDVTAFVFDEKEALRVSQEAIGNQLGDYTFLDRTGRTVRLSDYRGKPLVISMIYTHCPIVCATTTRSLTAIKLSQDALGVDSFGVLTVGFDTENDTPETMGDFAKRMDVNLPNWDFVSADPETIKKLSKDLGFTFAPSQYGGFNHITQTTFIDANGRVYLHIYGEEFENKTLITPLKDLIYNIKTARPGIEGISGKVKLFCTIYDARTGKYVLDYSYFYAMGMGVLVTLVVGWWLVLAFRRAPKRAGPDHG